MSDILIKNMEIPKDNKRIFLCIEKDGEVGVFEEKKLIRFTEAQDLSSHGRLIDADALSQNTIMIERNIERNVLLYKQYDTVVFVDDIENAPTVVEASNG